MNTNGSDGIGGRRREHSTAARGTGHVITRKCDECNKLTGRMAGGRMVRGMWWCCSCVQAKGVR